MLRTALILPVLLALAFPAAGQWSREQRGQFSTDCTESCRENPQVHPTRRGECAAYCGCVMGEAEKFISEAEYDRLNDLVEKGGSDPKLDRFRTLLPMCNRRIFGQ